MTDEERRIITGYVERVSGAAGAQPARPASPWGALGGGGQQAQGQGTSQAPLPPVDREADALIGDLFNRYPEARYRMVQTAFVQEHAVIEMQNRIKQLEWEVENAQAQAQAQPSRGGFLGGMFGGGGNNRQAPMRPQPQPQYPQGYNPQQFQQQGRGGSGFMGTAVAAAVGVAGGMMLGNALSGAFGGSHGAAAAATPAAAPAGDFGQEAVGTSSSWTDPGGAGNDAAPYDTGTSYGNDAAADDTSYDSGGGGYDEEI